MKLNFLFFVCVLFSGHVLRCFNFSLSTPLAASNPIEVKKIKVFFHILCFMFTKREKGEVKCESEMRIG
jgi:hypothetical protein